MKISHKLSVDKTKSDNFRVFGRDETGPYTMTNPNGYGGNNGNPPSSILKYIMTVEDRINGTKYKRIFGIGSSEVTNPPVERIAYREDFEVYPDNLQKRYPDSIYTLNLTTIMEYEFEGTAIEGQDFLINVSGVSVLENYNCIISPSGNIYKITSITGNSTQTPIVFLDRVLTESFEQFNVGFSTTSDPFLLNQDLEDCLSKKISQFACGSCDEKISKEINEIRIIYWGLKKTMELGDYLQALEYMKKCQEICYLLNCGCNGK